MVRFSKYIADQILNYLNEYYIVGDYEYIINQIDKLIPKYIVDKDLYVTASKDDEIKIIQQNWEKLSDEKKVEILSQLGELDKFFANLIYQKSLSDPEFKSKFKELFLGETKEEGKEEKKKEGDEWEETKEKDIEEIEKIPEPKNIRKETENNIKFIKMKESPYEEELLGVKSIWQDRLKHEVDQFSIFRDYAVDDKDLDKDVPDSIDNVDLNYPESSYDTGDLVPTKMKNLKKEKKDEKKI